MNTANVIRKATKRLLDSVWTITFIVIDGKAYILNYSREDADGYENETKLMLGSIIETEGRTASSIVLCPYDSSKIANMSNATETYEIGNPKYIFDYRS